MRSIRLSLLLAAVLLASCSDADQPSDQPTAPTAVTALSGPALNVSGAAADSTAIEGLILQLYNGINNGNGPLNSRQTRFRQVAALYTNCSLTPPQSPCNVGAAQSNTYDLIGSILGDYKSGTLNVLPAPGTGQAVTNLINLLLRYVDLDANVCTFGTGVDCDATIYQPGSPATILTAPSGLAGVSLPEGTGTVDRPTIISVSRIADPNVRLATGLDQYAYRYLYTSSSGQGVDVTDPFLREVTVEVCLDPSQTFPAGALARLVMAHSVAEPEPYENIQILPSGPAFLTACAQQASSGLSAPTLLARAWQAVSGRVGALLGPAPLQAVALETTTGTVGRTKTLSPFGAVDPFGFITPNGPTSGTAPEGGTAAAPSVRVVTASQLAAAQPTGPGMAGVAVTFQVTAGGGCFANPCTPSSPTSLTVNTDANGYASVPAWTVGVGANTVTATGAIACGAPVVAGSVADCGSIVTLAGDAALTFSVTGLPPTQVGFTPATLTVLTTMQTNGYAPGTPFNATVLVQDAENPPRTVPGSNAVVTLAITGGTLVCPSGCTQTAVNGVATFTGVYVTSVGSFTLTATSTGLAPAAPAPGGGINSVAPPSSAASITISAGNNQTAPEGTVLGGSAGTIAPSVRVTDAFGNLVGGAGVSFMVASGAGSVGSPAAVTSALGIASTTWSIVAGTNTLNAYITALGAGNAVSFTATGTSVTRELLSCSPASGSGDELTKAFYWTKAGNMKTLKQVTLYLASNDPANVPTPFTITLKATQDSYSGAVVGTSTQTVYLRGSASENLATQFTFPNVSLPSGKSNVYFQFVVSGGPAGVRLTFAKSASTCADITKTASPSSTASIGKGVGIRILGS
ncbi:MAG TPA: hypothetical protein VFV65_04560 [Gemmatimonadales bacterium]|nr:hypothetical protein [Gemmatimonadales bacterium]